MGTHTNLELRHGALILQIVKFYINKHIVGIYTY